MKKKRVSKQKKHNDIDDTLWAKIEKYFRIPNAREKISKKMSLRLVYS